MEKGRNMKTNIKRIFSVVLALLMLLPVFTSLAFAKEDVDVTNVPKNIAFAADIVVEEGLTWSGWKPEYLVDGDATTGTYTPRGKTYAIALEFAKPYYFSDFIVSLNREGTLPTVNSVPEKFSNTTEKIKILAYNGSELVYESAVIDTTGLTEVSANIWKEADKVVVTGPDISDSPSACEAIWEIEAYSRTTPDECDAETKNVASEALFSALQWVQDKDTKESYLANATWWAMDTDALFDGDPHTGTKSVKNRQFSYQLDFGAERMFSAVKIITNGAGTVANQDPVGCVYDEDGNLVEYKTFYTGYQMQVFAYNFNDDLVYQSDVIDVSSLEDVTFNIGQNVSIIRCEVSGAGNTGYNGGTLIWEIEAYEETGSHALERSAVQNPSCVASGYIEYTCQDKDCGYVVKEAVEPTGFHTWSDDYVVKTEPELNDNGVAQYTCKICKQTINRDIPALGHNWDAGTIYEPTCDEEGYTEYKCTDAGCDMTYQSDFVIALGHNFDDGVITKRPTIDSKGVLKYSCLRDGCDGEEIKELRKSRYKDNVAEVNVKDIIVRYESTQTFNANLASNAYDVLAKHLFDGVTNEGKHGNDDKTNYFYVPGNPEYVPRLDENGNEVKDANGKVINDEVRHSGFLYLYLDREYFFTRGTIFAAANYRRFEVHFEYQNDKGEWVRSATYAPDQPLNNMTVSGLDMTGHISSGARASRIVIESITGDFGWSYGKIPEGSPSQAGRLQFHEIQLTAHLCELTKEDYEPEANWNKATCTTDGSCKATCPVCNVTQTVILPKEEYGHSFGAKTTIVPPTCSENGYASAQCTNCSYTKTDFIVEKTGEHNFTKAVTHIEPTCDSKGIEHLQCVDCGKVGFVSPIESTGIHKYDWIVKSVSNYTAEGTTIHACVFCGEKSGQEEDIIEEKLPIPEGFVSFKGYEIRMTGFVGLRVKFAYDIEALNVLTQTCDVTITVNVTDSEGNVKSVEVMGKKGTQNYNKETGEFAVVVKAPTCLDEYSFSYTIKLVNFRGTVSETYDVNEGATTSIYDVAEAILNSGETLPAGIKKLYQEIVAEK